MDDDGDLAGLLHVPLSTLHHLLGRGWRHTDVLDRPPGRRWFGSGRPVQVLIAADGDEVVLARPRGTWDGAAGLRYEALDRRTFACEDLLARPAALAAAARDVTTRRRQSFRWCPTCRRLRAPEDFERSAQRCMPCREVVDGVVH